MITKNKISLIIGGIISAAIIIFLLKTLYNSLQNFPLKSIQLNYYYIGISVIILIFVYIISVFVWVILLKFLGEPIKFKQALYIISVSQISRFIPGKIWPIMGKIYLGNKIGIKKGKILLSIALENIIGLIAAISIALLVVYSKINLRSFLRLDILFLILLSCIILMHPSVIQYALKLISKITKRQIMPLNLKYTQLLLILLFHICICFAQCIGFFFLLRSVYPISLALILPISGMYMLSYLIGFLSFVTPGGLGVKEGVLSVLLTMYIPASFAIMIALVSRLWTLIPEILFLLVSLIFLRKNFKHV